MQFSYFTQNWLRKSKMKDQEEFGSDDEAQPKQAQSRRGRGANSKRIEVVGHRPFSKSCALVSRCILF